MTFSSLKKFYETHNAWVLACAAALLMGLVLFSFGGIGLSNNGDFGRVMEASSLAYAEDNVSFVYQSTFRMEFQGESVPEKLWNLLFTLGNTQRYPSIHLVFVRVSLAGNLILNLLTGQALSVYHVEVLGLLYLLCYAGLLFLLFRSFRLSNLGCDLCLKALVLFVLCDEGYLAYFNSLYSEPVQILGLLAMAVFGLRAWRRRGRALWNLLFFFVACLVYGWSKFINLPAAALCAAALGAALALGLEKRYWKWAAGGAGLCLAVLASVYLSLPGWMDYETNFNAVFYGILKDTSPQQQARYLEELGLPQEMAQYANSNYYSARSYPARQSQEFREAFQKVTKFDLLFFYLRHPRHFLSKLDVAMAHSGFLRPFYLSNLGGDSPRLTFAGRFGGWSYLRSQLPVNTWWFSGLLFLSGSLALWRWAVPKGSGKKAYLRGGLLLFALLGAAAYQFLIPIVTNGEGDLAKHMFAFAEFTDLFLLASLFGLGHLLCLLPRPRHPGPVLAAGLAAACCLALFLPKVLYAFGARLPHKGLEPGAYVQLGALEGEPLLWQAVEREEDGSFLLLAVHPVAEMAFDETGDLGSSLWEPSQLREWLNGEFFQTAFSPGEQSLVANRSHRVLLSRGNRDAAQSGNNDFFAFHIPKYSARGIGSAYAREVTDLLCLPDIALLARLSQKGMLSGSPCWMETPYYNNDSMVRTVGKDGYFYMRDAAGPYPVRPLLQLSPHCLPQAGKGSASSPFRLS